ncbi:MAG: hypothetical protein IJF74_05265 [Clostridia bacterium]|nr:hypothetical protein [Clostridia bacterium]
MFFKKTFLMFLALVCICSFASCGEKTPSNETEPLVSNAPVTDPATEPVTEPPVPERLAIFIDGENGNDENDGKTAEKAVETFEKAFSLLDDEHSLIVIVNTVFAGRNYEMPEYNGEVTITSLYKDEDYRAANGAALNIFNLLLSSDIRFENVAIAPQTRDSLICCRFNDLSVGEGVTVNYEEGKTLSIIGGYYVTDLALNQPNTMKAEDVSYKGDCHISVMSGTWKYLIGGNYRVGINSAVGTFDGNLTVDIGGDAEFRSGARYDDIVGDVVTAGGENIHKGSVTLNISGGKFACPVYGISKLGTYMNAVAANDKTGTSGLIYGSDVKYEADIAINISGGDFTADNCAYIGALQTAGDTAVHGDFKLAVTGGEFGDNMTFSALGMIGTSTAEGIPAGKEAKCFNTVNGKANDGAAPVRIACIGDSITFGTAAWGETKDGYYYAENNFFYPTILQQLYGYDAVVGNFGFPGSNVSTTSYSKYYQSCSYNMMMAFEPDIIVIALGTNNAPFIMASVSAFKNDYRTMIDDMHTRYPYAKMIMTTALYRWDDWSYQMYAEGTVKPNQIEIAKEYEFMTLYDTYKEFKPYGKDQYYRDKLHPNNEGYSKLAEVMKKGIDPLIEK